MPRTLPAGFINRVFGIEDDEPTIMLAEFDHDELGSPIRVCCNLEDLSHNGNTYLRFLFVVDWPSQKPGERPAVNLKIDNIDQRIIEGYQSVSTAPWVTLTLVAISDWGTTPKEADTIIAQTPKMTWAKARYTAGSMIGQLEGPQFLAHVFPTHSYTPSVAPGIHAGR